MPQRTDQRLTRREREIMNAIFALGDKAAVEAIRSHLSKPPSVSAVRVMLARLERKGMVTRRPDGPRFLYSPTLSRAAAQRSALRQFLGTFFGGSLPRMMTAFLEKSAWTDDELDTLQTRIDALRRKRERTKS